LPEIIELHDYIRNIIDRKDIPETVMQASGAVAGASRNII